MTRVSWIFLIQIIFMTSTGVFPQENKTADLSSALVDYSWVRDTVYTLKPYYIELNLSTQKGYLHSRTEPVKEFGISSGTEKLEDGVETKTGLFVIQAKMEKWYSRQFDSTLMLNWMGFNWGIGFHALQGSGYYRYLGKKRSSHGCVRITRQMAEELYSKIDEGTPVLVHDGQSAVKVAFGDPADFYVHLNFVNLKYQLNKRYQELYGGKYFLAYNPKLLIDFNNVYHEGLPTGDSKKIAKYQVTVPVSEYISSSIPPPRSFMLLPVPLQKIQISMECK